MTLEKKSNIINELEKILSIAVHPLSVNEIIEKLPINISNAKNIRNSISSRLSQHSDNTNNKNNLSLIFHRINGSVIKYWLIERLDELDNNLNREDTILDILKKTNKPLTAKEITNKIYSDYPYIIDMKKEYYKNKNIIKTDNELYTQLIAEIASFCIDKRKKIYNLIKIDINENNTKVYSLKTDENEIQKFSNFTNQETEKNPFIDAICVLGDSGAGKSYRVEKILEHEGMETITIIPSSVSSSLLYDYSTTNKTFELSELGDFIKEAKNNSNTFYTVVFDEFHKYINVINKELLQGISTSRNNGIRFISLPKSLRDLYEFLDFDKKRRMIIPNNLGFIFITSKSDIARDNDDFKNRVKFITLPDWKTDEQKDNYTKEYLINKIEKSNYTD